MSPAGETVERAHPLDSQLQVYRGDQLLRALSLPLKEHAERRPQILSSALKRTPRIYTRSGRSALAAVT